MKVERLIEVPDDGHFRAGDICSFCLNDGTLVRAAAVQEERGGMVFMLLDSLPKKYRMNSKETNAGGYEISELRRALNGEILSGFPSELRERMRPFPNGDTLRLPTEMEIFGVNRYGTAEPYTAPRWKLPQCGTFHWYWLENAVWGSRELFVVVNSLGRPHYSTANAMLAVRPVFKLAAYREARAG